MNDDFLFDYADAFEDGVEDYNADKDFDFYKTKCLSEESEYMKGWKDGWLSAQDTKYPSF